MKTLIGLGLLVFTSLSFAQAPKVLNSEKTGQGMCTQDDGCEALSFSPVGLNTPEVSEIQANEAFDAADMVLKDIGRSIASETEEE